MTDKYNIITVQLMGVDDEDGLIAYPISDWGVDQDTGFIWAHTKDDIYCYFNPITVQSFYISKEKPNLELI